MNKATLAREIGNYFLHFILVPRTKKVFYDAGKRHLKGYQISRFNGTKTLYHINKDSYFTHDIGNARMQRPKSMNEFRYYYSYFGAKVPVRNRYGTVLKCHGKTRHKIIKSRLALENDKILRTAFSKVAENIEKHVHDDDNFRNNQQG